MHTGLFFPYSWHLDDEETEVTSIRIYGINEHKKNICLRIDNFTPFVYLELPKNIPWSVSKAQLVVNKINEILGNQRPLSCSLQWKYKLYGVYLDETGNRKKFPYLFCSFSNKGDIKNLTYKLKNSQHIVGLGSLKLKIHESDADPILQLTCCREIPTAGWIKFHGKAVEELEKLTICDEEYKVKWKNVSPVENCEHVARPKIMGFDIEVNSTNPSAMPKAEKVGDKIFQISCVLAIEGDKEDKYEKYLLTLGQPEQETVGEDVLIYYYETEAALLEGFTTFIREENPNIIVGYNILGFDIPYMIARAKLNMCIFDFDRQGFHKFAHAKERIIKWSSSAYKNQEFEFLDAEGRVYVDLLPLVKRDFKFNNYKLKTISEYFIGETKDPLSAKGIFKCYRIGMRKNENGEYIKTAQKAMSIVGKYCVQDSVLVVKLCDKLKTWVGLTEMASVCNVPIFSLYTQGQQIKVYSQLYKYCMYNNIVVEKDGYEVSENERYVGAKVFPPIPGRYEMVVPFDFASLYPTTIIAYNIDYHTWVPPDSNIPDHLCHVMEWQDHVGCEHDPKVIRKTQLNNYIDLEKAEIKKLREKRNTTKDKLRKKEIMDIINSKNDELKPYIEERSELTKTISKNPMCAKRKYKFLKEPRGVLPTVIQNCLDARKHTRKIDMKKCKEEISRLELDTKENNNDNTELISYQKTLLDVLDKRQLAFKVSANSVSATTPIPCKINNVFVYRTIENISKGDWVAINEEQEISTPIDNLLVWSDKGFTKPKYVMRHPEEKPLKRVVTHTGIVDCTEDHSLLSPDGTEVKPSELIIGDELMHKQYPLPKDTPLEPLFKTLSDEIITNYILEDELEELAFVHGLFFAEGTCGTWGERIKSKSSWIIYNQNYVLLERALKILNKFEDTFEISRFYETSKVYHLRVKAKIKPICDKYRKLFYDNRGYKIVPDYILNSVFKIRQAFFMGYYVGDGARKLPVGVVISNRGQIGTASLMYIANSLGYKVSISNGKHDDQFRLQCSTNFRNVNTDKIKDMYNSYPYSEEKIMIPEVIINNNKIEQKNGVSVYRRIKIYCERLPRQKLLDSLDECIDYAEQRYSYITEYNTNNKKLTYKKYCCGKEYTIQMRVLKLKGKEINNCNCNQTKNNEYYNISEPYEKEKKINYVYDIETENHHFAAGIGHMIVHNSMYGAMGVRRGYLPFMPGAMVTTFMGRTNIEVVAKTIPEKFGGELVYGDTDTCLATTPVLILKNDNKYYTTLENLSAGDWKKTVTGKEISSPKHGIKVWSDQGFTEIKYVMRHAIEKPMIKVTTHTATIVCTLDHSLLWENGEPALGSEIKLKDKLCHRNLPLPDDTPKEPVYPNNLTSEKIREYIISDDVYQDLSAELAFVWGVFFADGSCGSYQRSNSSALTNTWAINKKDNLLLERCLNILLKHETDLDFKILDTMKSSHVNKLVAKQKSMKKEYNGTIKEFVERYRELFYDNRNYKKVPDIVLNAPYSIREAFFMGYYAGDGSKKDPALTITNKGEIGCAGLFFLLRSIGYQVSINTRGDKPDTYKLTGSTPMQKFRYHPNAVKKIETYETDDEYIYDIETSNHHFAAGIGQMVVHNSNYIHFPHIKGAKETWDYSLYVASEVTKLFPKPIELEFEEEIYAFFFILSKKRYMYRKCLRDGVVDTKIGKKGVLLARRDNSKFIRDIYEDIISKIADNESKDKILYHIISEINELCSGAKPYTDFTVTKSVGDSGGLIAEPFYNEKGIKKAKVGDYTVPILSTNKEEREEQLSKKDATTADEYYLYSLPAQVQLAERMRRRGQRVDAGTRLEYIVCNPENHTGKQYEKIENTEYLAKHREYIKIDYLYYLKALINPLDQVLDVAFGKDPDYKKGFIDAQYKFRLKNRNKLLEEYKNLYKPKLIIK